MKITKVTESLYSGAKPSYKTLKYLKKEGVTNIYDLRTRSPILILAKLREHIFCKLLGLNYIKKPVDLSKEFPTMDFLTSLQKKIQNTKTYFHCTYGKHRAGIITQAISVLEGKKNIHQATKELIDNGYFNYPKFFQLKVKDFFNPKNAEIRKASLNEALEKFKELFETAGKVKK